MIENNKMIDMEIIPSSRLYPMNSFKIDSKNLKNEILTKKFDCKNICNEIVLKNELNGTPKNTFLNKKVFYSDKQTKKIKNENKQNTLIDIFKSFSLNKYFENIESITNKGKQRNFSQSPNLKKYSKIKSIFNLSEILYFKESKNSNDFNYINGAGRNTISFTRNFLIDFSENKMNKNINHYVDKRTNKQNNENIINKNDYDLHFNTNKNYNKNNLFLIYKTKKNNKENNGEGLKINVINNNNVFNNFNNKTNEKLKDNLSNAENCNKSNIFTKNIFTSFYQTPKKTRFSKSANLKNHFSNNHRSIKNQNNPFSKVLNNFDKIARPYNNNINNLELGNNYNININKLKRQKKIIDIEDQFYDNYKKKNEKCVYRKSTYDDYHFCSKNRIINKNLNFYLDKKHNPTNTDYLHSNNFSMSSLVNGQSIKKNLNKDIYDINNITYANNNSYLTNKNNNKNRIEITFDDNQDKNTEIKTNFKSNFSNTNSAFTLLNTDKNNIFNKNKNINYNEKINNESSSFDRGIIDFKRNINFNDIIKTENKNSSKSSFISFKSNNSGSNKGGSNVSVLFSSNANINPNHIENSIINSKNIITKNNFLEFLNKRNEEKLDLLNNSLSKKSSSNFSEKFLIKSNNSQNFIDFNPLFSIRTNFTEFKYSYVIENKNSINSEDQTFNEIIMGDINSIYEKINKNNYVFYEIKKSPKKFEKKTLQVVNNMDFLYLIRKDSKSRISSLNNSSLNLNVTPNNDTKKLEEIKEDHEENFCLNFELNKIFNKDKCNISSNNKSENFYEYEDVNMSQKQPMSDEEEIKENNSFEKSGIKKNIFNKISNKSINSSKSNNSLNSKNDNIYYFNKNNVFKTVNIENDINILNNTNNNKITYSKNSNNNLIDLKLNQFDELINNQANNFINFVGNIYTNNNLFSQNIKNINETNNFNINKKNESKDVCIFKNPNNVTRPKSKENQEIIIQEENYLLDNFFKNNIDKINTFNTYVDVIRREYISELLLDNSNCNNLNSNNMNKCASLNNNQKNLNLNSNLNPTLNDIIKPNNDYPTNNFYNYSSSQNPLTQSIDNSLYFSQNIQGNALGCENINFSSISINNNTNQINTFNNINNILSKNNNTGINNNYGNFYNQYMNNSITSINNNVNLTNLNNISNNQGINLISLVSNQSSVNLNLPNSIYGTQLSNITDFNNGYLDIQLPSNAISINSFNSTKANTNTQTSSTFNNLEKELIPYIFNHEMLPVGKENDEFFKAKLANLIKNPKLPQFHSDFHKKKRNHSEMLSFNYLVNNYKNINIGENQNTNLNNNNPNINVDENNNSQNFFNLNNNLALLGNNYAFHEICVTKKANPKLMLRICEEDQIDYTGGIPEIRFMKYRKVSSCKTNYSSFISFLNRENTNVYFRIYRDMDVGFEEKYQKLTKIHV